MYVFKKRMVLFSNDSFTISLRIYLLELKGQFKNLKVENKISILHLGDVALILLLIILCVFLGKRKNVA